MHIHNAIVQFNSHFECILRLLLERVRYELDSGEWKLLHVLDVGDGSLQSTASDSVTCIHCSPTFEVNRVTVCRACTGAYEWNAMVRYVYHVNERISIEDINTRRLHVDFHFVDIPNDDSSVFREHTAEG